MSITLIGLFTFLIGRLLQSVGIPTVTEEINTFLTVAMQIIGALVTWWGRYKQGDINIFGVKK